MDVELEQKRQEEQQKERLRNFLLRDYELKVTYLTNHFQRMWTRFNFFVTIKSALVGGKVLLIKSDGPSVELALTGAALSFVWYVMGSQDRYLVRLYRDQARRAGE